MFVFDASVMVNAIVLQKYTAAAMRWLETPTELIAPEFLRLEVANALWKYENAANMSREEAEMSWRAMIDADIRLVPDFEYLDRARTMARNLDHPIYDCLYLAVAQVHQATLITADRRLFRVADGQRDELAVSWIEDDPPLIPRS